MTNQLEPASYEPIPLDAIAEWLERHPNIAAVIITEEIEETYE